MRCSYQLCRKWQSLLRIGARSNGFRSHPWWSWMRWPRRRRSCLLLDVNSSSGRAELRSKKWSKTDERCCGCRAIISNYGVYLCVLSTISIDCLPSATTLFWYCSGAKEKMMMGMIDDGWGWWPSVPMCLLASTERVSQRLPFSKKVASLVKLLRQKIPFYPLNKYGLRR
jgi:hypothetical protein